MAQKVQIQLLSDLELAKDPESKAPADLTRRFAVDGAEFEIDLTEAESTLFDEAVAPYLDAARPIGRGGRTKGQGRPARSQKDPKPAVDTVRVREWAREQGIEVKDRGRVPADVVEKYQAAFAG
jgi:Lsr2